MEYNKPKGTIDYFGESSDKLKFISKIIENNFVKNGGEYIETPVFENKEVIMSKYGDEAENKLIYEIEDNGGHKLVLRYDLTVPFTRWIKENGIDKIRRYSIGKVYRRDNPNISQGRFREFYQADFDILGETSNNFSAELLILNMIKQILFDLNLTDFTILVNFTDNLKKILIDDLKVPFNNFKSICSTIDKLDKTEYKNIIPELQQKGLSEEQIIMLECKLKEPFKNDLLDELLDIYNLKKFVKYKTSLARGLDYYDGIIFEVKLKNNNSTIIAGGRYDGLLNKPLIGFSIGITRLMQFYKLKNEENNWKDEYYLTCIGNIDSSTKNRVIKYCQDNITENYKFTWSLENDKKLGKVLSEKAKNWVRYVIIVAEDEIKNNQCLLKNLETGTTAIFCFK
jgi:histidyl-tRNA synthetase